MNERIEPPEEAVARTHCTAADYVGLYRQSLDDPDTFLLQMRELRGLI